MRTQARTILARIALAVFLGFCLAWLPQISRAVTYYVDVNYDGFNGPSDGSTNRPFTSISAISGIATSTSYDVVLVADGIYSDSGQSEAVAWELGCCLERRNFPQLQCQSAGNKGHRVDDKRKSNHRAWRSH